MNKLNKLTLPTAILIASIILGGAFYAIQVNKQKSIEKQQQIELQIKTEQDKRDYIAKRKTECLAIYKDESGRWNNIVDWKYHKLSDPTRGYKSLSDLAYSDTCEIICKDNKTGENFSKYY